MLLVSIGRTRLPRPEAQGNAIRAAVDAGVRLIAYTSWIGISHRETGGLAPDHAPTEEILRGSGAAWTMLRNSIYMNGVVNDAAAMLATGRVTVPENADRITYVTREDCAAAAAAVLATPNHEPRDDITGPEAVGPREIAAAASAVTGVAIEVVSAPAGAPSPFGGPGVTSVSRDFEALVGRSPTSVRQFLEERRSELVAARGRGRRDDVLARDGRWPRLPLRNADDFGFHVALQAERRVLAARARIPSRRRTARRPRSCGAG